MNCCFIWIGTQSINHDDNDDITNFHFSFVLFYFILILSPRRENLCVYSTFIAYSLNFSHVCDKKRDEKKQILWTLSYNVQTNCGLCWFESVASIIGKGEGKKCVYLLSCHFTKMFQFCLPFFLASILIGYYPIFVYLFCMKTYMIDSLPTYRRMNEWMNKWERKRERKKENEW